MSATWIYLTELAVIAAAVPGMLWLKRAGEREWARRKRRQVLVRLAIDTSKFTAAMAAMAPAMARATAAAADFERVFRKVQADIRSTAAHPARPEGGEEVRRR